MNTFARIEGGRVVEIIRTGHDPALLFHPALEWMAVDRRAVPDLAVNWRVDDGKLIPPPKGAAPERPATIAELREQLRALAAAVDALTPVG